MIPLIETETSTRPTLLAGAEHTSTVADTYEAGTASVPNLHWAAISPLKPEPNTVTFVPPCGGPNTGLTLTTVGAAVNVKGICCMYSSPSILIPTLTGPGDITVGVAHSTTLSLTTRAGTFTAPNTHSVAAVETNPVPCIRIVSLPVVLPREGATLTTKTGRRYRKEIEPELRPILPKVVRKGTGPSCTAEGLTQVISLSLTTVARTEVSPK